MSRNRNLGQQVTDMLLGEPADLGIKRVRMRHGTEIGTVIGGPFRCRLESCRGVTYSVRWSDGKLTRPCSEGMQDLGNGLWEMR